LEAKKYLSETPEIPEISHPQVDTNIVDLKKPWDSDAIALTGYLKEPNSSTFECKFIQTLKIQYVLHLVRIKI